MDKGPGNPSSNKIINYDERKVVQGKKMWELLVQRTSWNSSFFSSPVNGDDLDQNRKGLPIISSGQRLQDCDIQAPK